MSEPFNGIRVPILPGARVPKRFVVVPENKAKPQGYVIDETSMRKIRAKLQLIAGGYRANGLNMVTAQEIIGILQRSAIKFT